MLVVAAWALLIACGGTDRARPTEDVRPPPTAPAEDARVPVRGKWRRAVDAPELSTEERRLAAELEALGYADGTMAVLAERTVPTHDPSRAWQGLNLYTSGHAAEAFLTDMDGRVLHAWTADFQTVFPDARVGRRARGANHWRRVALLPDGGLAAIWEGRAMVVLERDGTVRWARDEPFHHHVVLHDGALVTLLREAGYDPALHPDKPVARDFVVWLDPATGEERGRLDLVAALQDGPWASVFHRHRKAAGDLLHTNAVQVLDAAQAAAVPGAAAGHLLVSSRTLSLVGVVDPDTARFVWATTGEWRAQHEPTITRDGHLMLFDNLGGPGGTARVLELTLPDLDVVWRHPGAGQAPLRSPTLGTAAELPNGNVLITESERGHALEVARDGATVWELYNPHRAGADGELIAALFEVQRLPRAAAPWAEPDE